MKQETLSVILPVKNRQDQIIERIESTLEMMVDLTMEVQLIIVDDGSDDATPELVDDLRRKFPQVAAIRNPMPLGPTKAAESAIPRAWGDFIFLHESYEALDFDALRHLWSLRSDRDIVVARAASRTKRIDDKLLSKLTAWGKRLEEHWTQETKSLDDRPLNESLQMIRRDSLEQLARLDPKKSDFEVSHLSKRQVVRHREKVATKTEFL